jgi:hypothetical protein
MIMAKAAVEKADFEFTSEVLQMTNVQTFGAASAIMAERIATPGYSDAGNGGMIVVAVFVNQEPTVDKAKFLSGIGTTDYLMQMQLGDHQATPIALNPDHHEFFGHMRHVYIVDTEGAITYVEPMVMPILRPKPYILTQYFSIMHRGTDGAQTDDTDWYTTVWYRTAMFSDKAYNNIYKNQTRLS